MKEKSQFVCPFCNGPIYVKRIVIKTKYESGVGKKYYCTCRGYRKMRQLAEKYRKEKIRTYKACERLSKKAKKYEEISDMNHSLNSYPNYVNYISFSLLGIMDSFDITKRDPFDITKGL